MYLTLLLAMFGSGQRFNHPICFRELFYHKFAVCCLLRRTHGKLFAVSIRVKQLESGSEFS